MIRNNSQKIFLNFCLFAFLLFLISFSLIIGHHDVSFRDLLNVFSNILSNDKEIKDVTSVIILEIRLPRVLMSVFVGASLVVSGIGIQGWMRNPLADPFLFGVSGGSAVGTVLCLLMFSIVPGLKEIYQKWLIPISSFSSGLIFAFFTCKIPLFFGKNSIISTLLIGVIMNLFASAIIGLVSILSSNSLVSHFTYWIWGSFANSNWSQLFFVIPLVSVSIFALFVLSKDLNCLCLGDLEAKSIGSSVKFVRFCILIFTTLMVSICVAFCGIIGFVGLLIPHCARSIVGSDHFHLIPTGALLGSIFLVLSDLLIRSHVSCGLEIPVGIITTFVGIPFFLVLFFKSKQNIGNV